MNLGYYQSTDLEKWINKRYQANGIWFPWDLDVDRIAALFKMRIRYYDGPCVAEWKEGGSAYIFIDVGMNKREQREAFFHELCHPLQHVGNQDRMNPLFKELQETQASVFQLYAAMPFFMIENLELPRTDRQIIECLSEQFGVTEKLAKQRLDQIQRRILQGAMDEEFKQAQQRRNKTSWARVREIQEQWLEQEERLRYG